MGIPMFCVGQKRYVMPDTNFMIHGTGFNAAENQRFELKTLEDKLKVTNRDNDSFAEVVAQACGKEKADILDLMLSTTYFSAKEAVKIGLVHEIKDKLMEPNGKMRWIK